MINREWAGRALIALGTLALAQSADAAQRHQQQRTALPGHQRPVSYEADGTPIATGAPRRLSALAVGGGAWAFSHEMRGKRHRPQMANKQQPQIR